MAMTETDQILKWMKDAMETIIEPIIKEKNLARYINLKLQQRLEFIIDQYEMRLLAEKVDKFRVAAELTFVRNSFNKLVLVNLNEHPFIFRAFRWYESSKLKKVVDWLREKLWKRS